MSTSPAELDRAAEAGPPFTPRSRTRVFVVLVVVLVLVATGYVVWAAARDTAPTGGGGAALTPGAPALLVQNLAEGDGHGRVAVAQFGDPAGARSLTDLSCDRLHFAAGRGLCLAAASGFPPILYAKVFGPDFRVTHEIPLRGLPSRARVSPDGRYGAVTVFVTGHSYREAGFSTNTTLIDMASGTAVAANLEEFTILRDGRPYSAPDVNFWGVTFAADSNRFFATLGTAGRTYLVDGDVAARRVVVGRENLECPSLSPDGTRIGFKKRVDDGSGSPVWRFHVLDLATGQENPLAETRSVDDQLEWLDNNTVLYDGPGFTHTVFSLPADGTGQPQPFFNQARSPTVLRTPLPDASVAGLAAGPQLTMANTDLGITIAGPATTDPGKPVVHTLTVTNHGPAEATRVVAEDEVIGFGRITSATADIPPGAEGYGCTVIAEENLVRCDLSRLPAGGIWTVTVTVTPTGSGALDGKALVGATEPDQVNNNNVASVRTATR